MSTSHSRSAGSSNLIQMIFLYVFLALLCSVNEARLVTGYKTFFVTEECRRDSFSEINMRSLEANSSGILKANQHGKFVPNLHCEILLKPPLSYDVVASIRLVDIPFNKRSNGTCEHYLQIFNGKDAFPKICTYSYDVLEFRSYLSTGPMKVVFHTTNTSRMGVDRMQFQLTFTAVRQAKLWCPNEEFHCGNNHCIWRGLICDGHNNCGDLSDEGERAKCRRSISLSETIAIVIGTVIICIVFLTVITCMRRYFAASRARRSASRNVPNSDRPRDYQSTVTSESPAINSRGQSAEDPPPKYEDVANIPTHTTESTTDTNDDNNPHRIAALTATI